MTKDEINKILTSCDPAVKYYFGEDAILTYYETFDRHGRVKTGGFYITYNYEDVSHEPITLHELHDLYNNYTNLNKRVR